jgi:hypothetical protein
MLPTAYLLRLVALTSLLMMSGSSSEGRTSSAVALYTWCTDSEYNTLPTPYQMR